MKLYDYVLSGNCHKVRLLLKFLDLTCDLEPVDFFPGREHKSPVFLQINPLGQLPVREDGDLRLRDAQAILVHLAHKYDSSGQWYPMDGPEALGRVAQWLAFAENITATSSAARLHDVLGYNLDVDAARAGAHTLFRVLEDHLAHQEFKGQHWLAGPLPTIADITCFPYTALTGNGGIDTFIYPAIERWLHHFSRLRCFYNMPGMNYFA